MTPTMFDISRPSRLLRSIVCPASSLAPNTNSVLKKLPEGRTDGQADAGDLGLGRVGHLTHDDFSQCLLSPRFCRSPQITSIPLSQTQPTNHGAEHSGWKDRHRQKRDPTTKTGGRPQRRRQRRQRPRLFRVTKRGKPAERRKCDEWRGFRRVTRTHSTDADHDSQKMQRGWAGPFP